MTIKALPVWPIAKPDFTTTWSRMTWRHSWNNGPLPLATGWLPQRLQKILLACLSHLVVLAHKMGNTNWTNTQAFQEVLASVLGDLPSPPLSLVSKCSPQRFWKENTILDEAPLCKGQGMNSSLIRMTNLPYAQWDRFPCYFQTQLCPIGQYVFMGFSLFLFRVYFLLHLFMCEIPQHARRSQRTTC